MIVYSHERVKFMGEIKWFQEPEPGVSAVAQPIGALHVGQSKHRTHSHVECLQQEEA